MHVFSRLTAVSLLFLSLMTTTSFAEVVVESDGILGPGGGDWLYRFTQAKVRPQDPPGTVVVGACLLRDASVLIRPNGRAEFKADIAANPPRVYKTRLIFVDRAGRRLEQWPHIRLFQS